MYDKTSWKARQGSGLNKFIKSGETGNVVYLDNAPDSITEPGTPFTAENMNHIEEGIAEVTEAVNQEITDRNTAINEHNLSVTSHADIRDIINNHIGIPAWDSDNYILTFTAKNGSTLKIDIPLESLARDLDFDPATKELVITKQDSTEIRVSVADLIDVYEGSTGSHIQITIEPGNVIRAILLSGSITEDELSNALLEKINGKVDMDMIGRPNGAAGLDDKGKVPLVQLPPLGGEGLPAGGAAGQILAKASDDDFDTEWVEQSAGGGGSFIPDFSSMQLLASSSTSPQPTTVTAPRDGFIRASWIFSGVINQAVMAINKVGGTHIWSGYFSGTATGSPVSNSGTVSPLIPVSAGDSLTAQFGFSAPSSSNHNFQFQFFETKKQFVTPMVTSAMPFLPDYTHFTDLGAQSGATPYTVTIPRDGFLVFSFYADGGSAAAFVNMAIAPYGQSDTVWRGFIPLTNGLRTGINSPFLPVKAGQRFTSVITTSGSGFSNLNQRYYFYDPVVTLPPQVNMTYALTEVDTGKIWVDGNPIYRLCFSGNFPAIAANTEHTIYFGGGMVQKLISSGGEWSYHPTVHIPINSYFSGQWSSLYISNGNISFRTYSTMARTTNETYIFWLEYTKY